MNQLTDEKKYDYCRKAIDAKTNIEVRFLELGAMLYKIKEQDMYEPAWSSWEEFRDELKLSDASVSKLLNIYKIFVLHYQIPNERLSLAGGWSAVAELLPAISPETTSRERVEELLDIATIQTRMDVRRTVSDVKRGKPCEHKITHDLHLRCCDDCSERWKIEA
jgi:hypothetical protein